MTPSEIKAALSSFGRRPNKRLGQNFLIDKKVLQTIVETADIQTGEHVLEIGPGLGVLTRELVARGAHVVAIERDRQFVEYLDSIFNSSRPPLKLRGGDAAKLDWRELIDDRPWKFISNLPYGITSLALRKALWSKNPPTKIVVLVQREVAERAIAKDGKTSLLSLMVALASREARIVKRVSPGSFYPPPKVESAILEIIPKQIDREAERVMSLAKKGFAHPRKLLFSNLVVSKEQRACLIEAGIPERARAEDLSTAQWVTLCRCFDHS